MVWIEIMLVVLAGGCDIALAAARCRVQNEYDISNAHA